MCSIDFHMCNSNHKKLSCSTAETPSFFFHLQFSYFTKAKINFKISTHYQKSRSCMCNKFPVHSKVDCGLKNAQHWEECDARWIEEKKGWSSRFSCTVEIYLILLFLAHSLTLFCGIDKIDVWIFISNIYWITSQFIFLNWSIRLQNGEREQRSGERLMEIFV